MEFVFVVPRTELFPERYPQGVEFFGNDLTEADLRAVWCRHGFFVERDYAERTPSLKQVIPYTVVARGDEILVLKRTKRGGDARLHDKLSIGVGGHVEPIDLPSGLHHGGSSNDIAPSAPHAGFDSEALHPRDPIPHATRREVLEEELEVDGDWSLHTLGLINDDSNSVGAVHVGLVQVLHVEGSVRIRETDTLEGSFLHPDALRRQVAEGANFESWSGMLVSELDRVLAPIRGNRPRKSLHH